MHPKTQAAFKAETGKVKPLSCTFMCCTCKRSIYTFKGRRRVGGTKWRCAECVAERNSIRADRGNRNADLG